MQDEEQMKDLCDLMKSALSFDRSKRYDIHQLRNCKYLTRPVKLTNEDVRESMEKRIATDKTISDEALLSTETNANLDNSIPPYIPYSWNTPIIRHTFQKHLKLD